MLKTGLTLFFGLNAPFLFANGQLPWVTPYQTMGPLSYLYGYLPARP